MAERKQHSRNPRQWLRSESDNDPYRTRLRIEFLEALHNEIPYASAKLVDMAGPAFEALADNLEELADHLDGAMPWWSLAALLKKTPPDAPLKDPPQVDWAERIVALALVLNDRLLEWAKLYHLHRDSWVPEHVFGALQMHRVEQAARRLMGDPPEPFRLGIWTPRLPNYEAPRFPSALEPWPYQPDRETRDAFRARVEVYADRVERFDKAARHSKEADYHAAEGLHLRRLVWYHCLGQTYDKVAELDRLDAPSSARKSIKPLYQDLPLTTPRPRLPRRRRTRR